MSMYNPYTMISIFPSVSDPDGYEICDGAVLTVAYNPEYEEALLYLGSTFGGDGTTTVGLPTIAAPAANLEYYIYLKGVRRIDQ